MIEQRMVRVYVSSAYTKGDTSENMHRHMKMACLLIDLGFAPYAPLLSHFLGIMQPRPYADWMNIDLSFLPTCDCMLRLLPPPESKGAEIEEAEARSLGLPVFYNIEDLVSHYGF